MGLFSVNGFKIDIHYYRAKLWRFFNFQAITLFMSHLPFLIIWQEGKLKQMLVYIKSALTVMILSNEQRLDKIVSFASRH